MSAPCFSRWQRFVLIVVMLPLSLFVSSANADKVHSSVLLNEAKNLVGVVPEQAKRLASSYLKQRVLAEETEKSPSTISREDTDSRIRTPSGTINALHIIASAESELGNFRGALAALLEANALAERHKLHFSQLYTEILTVQLRWNNDRDRDSALNSSQRLLDKLEQIELSASDKNILSYHLGMFRADIASQTGEFEQANTLYSDQQERLTNQDIQTELEYHITVGAHYLRHKSYENALSALLIAYWQSIDSDQSLYLAKANRLLAELFFDRNVLDKAIEHLLQAADFYDNYEESPILPPVLKLMGDIYYQQGKYNLALVHFFNVIDQENIRHDIHSVIDVRLSLAKTYLQLYNIPLAEQYLDRALSLLEYVSIPHLQANALLLKSGIAYNQKQSKLAISRANQALQIAKSQALSSVQREGYQLLYMSYQQDGRFDLALEALEKLNKLNRLEQIELNNLSEQAFRRQKEFIEQGLHLQAQQSLLSHQTEQFEKFRNFSYGLFILSFVLLVLYLRRGQILKNNQEDIDALSDRLFTHSRSGLANLRMLHAKLPSNTEESSYSVDKWSISDLIHEPLHDKLRFAMIDLPMLRSLFLHSGYHQGLKLERVLGDFLKQKVAEPARLFHFSDATLIYVEPNEDRDTEPQQLIEKIQQWIREFAEEQNLSPVVRLGIADYPFLPKAYTAINDKEMMDILLLATHAARELSLAENQSHWVYLKAIDNAPAASLANGNIRHSCSQAIEKGLIKVQCSADNEECIKKTLQGE